MNSIREILQINEQELQRGLAGTPASWHAKYSKSAWVYVGNLDNALTEGDGTLKLVALTVRMSSFYSYFLILC